MAAISHPVILENRSPIHHTQNVAIAIRQNRVPTMRKLMLVPLLFVIACLFAGAYGAIHNQVSFSVSPEYFTKFKFHQFAIGPAIPDRVGASIVGWAAAWWMGIVIGVVLIPVGLVIPRTARYFWSMVRVFGVVAATTFIVGIVALGLAYVAIDSTNAGEFTRYGNEIADDVAFARAGTMHNFSYLGGLVGIITGLGAILWERRSHERRLDQDAGIDLSLRHTTK